MQIDINFLDNLLVLSLSGRLDADEPDILRSRLRQLLQKDSNIIIDCSKLQFMDSRGLGALISSLRIAISNGGDIRLAAAVPKVKMMIELTRADKVFQLFETVKEAAASFKN